MNSSPFMLRAQVFFSGTQLHELYNEFGLPHHLTNTTFLQHVKTQATLRWIFAESKQHSSFFEVTISAGANDETTAAYAKELIAAKAQVVQQQLQSYRENFAISHYQIQMSAPHYMIEAWDDIHPVRRHLIRNIGCNDPEQRLLAHDDFRYSE